VVPEFLNMGAGILEKNFSHFFFSKFIFGSSISLMSALKSEFCPQVLVESQSISTQNSSRPQTNMTIKPYDNQTIRLIDDLTNPRLRTLAQSTATRMS
jgi:hypothetical protein